MFNRRSSLRSLQGLNQNVYGVTNDRNFSIIDMQSRLHRHTTQILKCVRKEDGRTIRYHLCSSLSWCMALANRLHFDVANEMWVAFPGVCPYCLSTPCACKKQRRQQRQKNIAPTRRQPVSLSAWQKMFWRIYPNIVIKSAIHLAEEAGEVDEALRNHLATHNAEWLRKATEEIIDTVTNIFAVASCLDINLAEEAVEYFADGCPGCKTAQCQCGYATVDNPIVSSKPCKW